MKRKSAFVLTEIIIACVIIAIIASIALATYQKARERTDQLLCETREKLIYTAVKMSIYDTGVVPASLTKVWDEYKNKAVAQLREENNNSRFPFVKNWALVKVAEASFGDYYGNDPAVITCPRDKTPPPGGVSYSIHSAAKGKTRGWMKANPNATLLYETDSIGGGEVYRHREGRRKVSNYITAGGKHRKKHKD
ncbi:MAG: hypothetical protein JSV30_03920 [Candidatus Omnitrophota bacterium]|nr:MAG: hypothetical protein JSV30_03920 [Candidatus Omnitrophota bacterium]